MNAIINDWNMHIFVQVACTPCKLMSVWATCGVVLVHAAVFGRVPLTHSLSTEVSTDPVLTLALSSLLPTH